MRLVVTDLDQHSPYEDAVGAKVLKRMQQKTFMTLSGELNLHWGYMSMCVFPVHADDKECMG